VPAKASLDERMKMLPSRGSQDALHIAQQAEKASRPR